jgi:hypothetical protein
MLPWTPTGIPQRYKNERIPCFHRRCHELHLPRISWLTGQHIVSPLQGMPTNAVCLGYTRTLLRIIKERKPVYMAAAFESRGLFPHA